MNKENIITFLIIYIFCGGFLIFTAFFGGKLGLVSWPYYILLFPMIIGSRYFFYQGFIFTFFINIVLSLVALSFYIGRINTENKMFINALLKSFQLEYLAKSPGLIWIFITYFVVGKTISELSEERERFKRSTTSKLSNEKQLKLEISKLEEHNKALNEELKKGAEAMRNLKVKLTGKMETLREVTTMIVNSLNKEAIYNNLIKACKKLLGAERVAIFKESKNVNALELVDSIGYDDSKIKFLDKKHGMVGWVYENKKLLTIDDVNKNYSMSHLLKNQKLTVSICSPLFIKKGIIDCILVIDGLKGGDIAKNNSKSIKGKRNKIKTGASHIVNDDDLRIVGILIDMTTLALKNAIYHEKSLTMADLPFDKIEDEEVKKEKMYKIGKSYEENEMYEGAIEIYEAILKIDSNYRDVLKKLERLRKLRAIQKEYEENKIHFTEDMLKKFKNVEKIGIGGMGVVYKALDIEKKITVAIKIIAEKYRNNEKTIQRFIRRDGMAARRLEHPNIVRVYDVVEGEVPYIVMEYIEGSSFRKILDKWGKIQPVYVKKIALQVGEALAYAHSNGIIHRDIKPDNIMLHRNKIIKLMDFGLAKILDVTAMTETGEVFGTLYYMPPEQLKGDSVADATDIYSLGVTLYEFLTGSLPYKGNNPEQIMYKIFNSEPEPPSKMVQGIPDGFDDIILKMMHKDINKRFQTAYEVIDAFKKLKLT